MTARARHRDDERAGAVAAQPVSPVLLDVTLRDGGYLNGHGWSLEQAVQVVSAIDAAGIPFTEVGYFQPGAADGGRRPAASSPPGYLERLAAAVRHTRLVVMAKPGACGPDDLRQLAASGVSMVRFPVPVRDAAALEPLVATVREAGMTASLNLTRISELTVEGIVDGVRAAAGAGADVVYVADSNGSLYPTAVRALMQALGDVTDVPIGFHAHDNLRMAFANSLAAVAGGATYLDGSVGGVGKGGGNLRLELYVAHLLARGAAGLRLRALQGLQAVVAREHDALEAGTFDAVVAGFLDLNLDQITSIVAREQCRVQDLLDRPPDQRPGPRDPQALASHGRSDRD